MDVFFYGFGALWVPLGSLLGPLEALLGGLESEKNPDSPTRKPLFEIALFRFLQLLMAFSGPSWLLLGQSGVQSGL